MVDLHLHTTASDGSVEPAALVSLAREAGLRTIAITDHDTLAGWAAARAAGEETGVEVVAGIEITAVHAGRDVHVLGYFVDPAHPALEAFLVGQRTDRISRVRDMASRLAALGKPIDVEPILARARGSRAWSVGRPAVAAALVKAGHAVDVAAAFDEWIGEGRPAFVSRRAATPAAVVRVIVAAGGIASLAHPGLLRKDHLIPALVEAGLGALEVYHTDHLPPDVARYRALARSLGLGATGGSDFHGDRVGGRSTLGAVSLPQEDWADLQSRVPSRRRGRP